MEKYGFVYIWFDRKHKRFYIGCRWGTETDGYICSSVWMKNSYKRRPQDFKRKILSRTTNQQNLLDEEYYWLKMIKPEELGKKYYNLRQHHHGHWTTNKNKLSIQEKMKNSHWSKDINRSNEIKNKISKSKKGQSPPNKGIPWSEELRTDSYSDLKGYKMPPRSIDHRRKISENNKRLYAENKIGTRGKKFSEETRRKMSENNAMNNQYNRQKISDAKKGIKCLYKEGIKKMAIPGTVKYETLINDGFVLSLNI